MSPPAPQLALFQERPALDAATEFDTLFWPPYPLKLGKAAARVAYLKARKSKNWPGIDQVLVSLEAQKQSPRWQAGVIPMAKTWLHQERWEDDAAALTWNGDKGKHFVNGRWVGPPEFWPNCQKALWWENFWMEEGRG